MKIIVNNKTLSTALSKVTSVIEKRNTIPILSNIHISPNDTTGITIQGTDLDITLSTTVKAVIMEPKPFTVSAAMLTDIVKRLPDGDVTLEYDGDTLHVKAGRSKFKMKTLPSVDFPAPKEPVVPHGFTVDASELKTWLERVSFAVSQEETRQMLNGVYMEPYEGNVRFVATDGHRLALQDTTIALDDVKGIIIPRKTVIEIQKLLASGGDVYINFSDALMVVRNEDTTLISKLIDLEYPQYLRILPQHNDMKMIVDADTIKKASDRVASINDERTRAVRITCTKGEVDLSVRASNGDDANETLDAQCDFELEIGVNSRYLADAMTRIDGEAAFSFADGNSPMVARQVGDDSYLTLIMPMRVN